MFVNKVKETEAELKEKEREVSRTSHSGQFWYHKSRVAEPQSLEPEMMGVK